MAPGEERPGDHVGPYRIERRLGVGGMGEVYRAVDVTLERPVALKLIAPAYAREQEFRERFLREARALAALDSPHVVQVYAAGDAPDPDGVGRLYIATRLMDGDLADRLHDHGALDPDTALRLVTEVAAGLAAAHDTGIVHRDIKPANVLLRERGGEMTAALGDFGIARRAGSQLTATSAAAMGTTGYMAPELHNGGPATVASDLYAMGCLLWAALTGTPPYAGETDYQVITGHLSGPIPQLTGTSPGARAVNDLLGRALSKDPAGRPASAHELVALLQAVPRRFDAAAGADPTRPSGGVAPPATAGPRRRMPVVIGGAVVAVLVLAGVLGYLLLHDRSSPDPSSTHTPSGSTTSGASASASTSTSGSASPSSPDFATPKPPFSATDVKAAKKSITTTFATKYPESMSSCIADKWVDAAGVDSFVKEDLFDDDWGFHDKDLTTGHWNSTARRDKIKSALTQAGLSCASAAN